jgi:hypothetical protein
MRKLILFLVLAAFMVNLFACGSFGPPASCGETIGGTADEALYGRYFSDMNLVSEATGEVPPPGSENSPVVSSDDPLTIKMQALKAAEVRACVQERVGGGGIPADESATVAPGEAFLPLGKFSSGSYVVRVIVDGALVKNLTFEVK